MAVGVEETVEPSRHPSWVAENVRLLPKIEPLLGSLQPELKRCGKPTCHCARGELHGPYWSLRWREGNRQHRRYVRPSEISTVRAALATWRALHPPARSTREQLAELGRTFRELGILESRT